MSTTFELTDDEYWDAYWDAVELPAEIRRSRDSLYINEILDRFDRWLRNGRGLSALEIGGAPGQYLAYMHRRFGYTCACLDYSARGCEKTRENFRLLGISGAVFEADVFDDSLDLPTYDVVFSLGLIEHFTDLEPVVARHLQFLKPGGTLVLGAPNLQGINKWFLQRLAPEILAVVEPRSMDLNRWRAFESSLGLTPLFRGYVGGLEPCVFRARRSELRSRPLSKVVEAVDLAIHTHMRMLRRMNGRVLSGYIMGIYRAPESHVSGQGRCGNKDNQPVSEER